MSDSEVTADATAYVRACDDAEAFGINPMWIPMVMISIFFKSMILAILTVLVCVFFFMAKRNGAKPFDLARRIRRLLVGPKRNPFRGF